MRSTISTFLTVPDLDAGDPDVVALHHAGGVGELGLVLAGGAEVEVADGDDQDAGRQRGHDHEDEQLDQVDRWCACREPSSQASPPPLAPSGPTRRTPRSGTSVGGQAEPRAEQGLEDARPPRGCRRSPRPPPNPGATRLMPLPVGRVDAVVEVRLVRQRVGLGPRRVGQVQAVGSAGVTEPRHVGLVVAARLVGQRLQHDVQREAAEGLGLQLAGVDDARRSGRGTPGRTSPAPAAARRRARRAG